MRTPEEQFSERLISVIDDAGGAAAVARLLEITPAAVRLWLRGTRPYPHHIRALCEKLQVDRHWLLTGEQREEPQESLGNTSLREEPKRLQFEGVTDEALSTQLIGMIRNFAKVPSDFITPSLVMLRECANEFIARAEMRAQGNGARFPSKATFKKHKP